MEANLSVSPTDDSGSAVPRKVCCRVIVRMCGVRVFHETVEKKLHPRGDCPSKTKQHQNMRHSHMQTWMPMDDAKLVSLIGKHGCRWKLLTKAFPGRTIASVRNRWLRILAGKDAAVNNNNNQRVSKCGYCGQAKRGHICWALLYDTTAAMAEEDEAKEEEYNALALSVKSMQIPLESSTTSSILVNFVTE